MEVILHATLHAVPDWIYLLFLVEESILFKSWRMLPLPASQQLRQHSTGAA